MQSFFAYIRVSTQKQGQHGVSLQEQRAAIERHAQRQQLTIARWFEERETAAKRGRPIFTEMLKELRRGKASPNGRGVRSEAGYTVGTLDLPRGQSERWTQGSGDIETISIRTDLPNQTPASAPKETATNLGAMQPRRLKPVLAPRGTKPASTASRDPRAGMRWARPKTQA